MYRDRDGRNVWVTFDSSTLITTAQLNFTKDQGQWQKRLWENTEASVDGDHRKVTGVLPEGTEVYYFKLIDDRGLTVSSAHEEIQ